MVACLSLPEVGGSLFHLDHTDRTGVEHAIEKGVEVAVDSTLTLALCEKVDDFAQ
jgi:hypothetical protein